jgi:8-oxo-dGTP diphosphatase
MGRVIITTMCALINNKDEILFINRKNSWKGLALPGGHLEKEESIYDGAKREILEETGLAISKMNFKGITHFYNTETRERYMVFNFSSRSFSGNLKTQCNEGTLHWIHKDRLTKLKFADGMDKRFDLFFNENQTEMYIELDEKNIYQKIQINDFNNKRFD